MKHAILSFLFCWTVMGSHIRVIDGDTFVADLSVWHGITAMETIRVLGVDSPEMRSTRRKEAQAALSFTRNWLEKGKFSVESCKRDSFGRALAKVYRPSVSSGRAESVLAQDLINAGHGIKR